MKRLSIVVFIVLALVIASIPVFAIEIDNGSWSGSVKVGGQSASITAHFSGGSFSTSGGGYSLSGTYSVSGKKVKLNAKGLTITLKFSDNGTRQKMSGSGTKLNMKWTLSLSRATPAGAESKDNAKSKKLAQDKLYGEYTGALNGTNLLIRLYKDGFMSWTETVPGENGAEPVVTEYAALMNDTVAEQAEKSLSGQMELDFVEGSQQPTFCVSDAQPGEDGETPPSVLTMALDVSASPSKLTLTNALGETVAFVMTKTTLETFPVEPLLLPNLTIERGDKGEAVKLLQEKLIEGGYLDDVADGAFGKKTQSGVSAFEKANDIAADGVAGPEVMRVLFG